MASIRRVLIAFDVLDAMLSQCQPFNELLEVSRELESAGSVCYRIKTHVTGFDDVSYLTDSPDLPDEFRKMRSLGAAGEIGWGGDLGQVRISKVADHESDVQISIYSLTPPSEGGTIHLQDPGQYAKLNEAVQDYLSSIEQAIANKPPSVEREAEATKARNDDKDLLSLAEQRLLERKVKVSNPALKREVENIQIEQLMHTHSEEMIAQKLRMPVETIRSRIKKMKNSP